MVVTDPIADMLTRIRNANANKYKEVSMPVFMLKQMMYQKYLMVLVLLLFLLLVVL